MITLVDTIAIIIIIINAVAATVAMLLSLETFFNGITKLLKHFNNHLFFEDTHCDTLIKIDRDILLKLQFSYLFFPLSYFS